MVTIYLSTSRTSDEKFIPKPVQPKAIFHSLTDLLNNVGCQYSEGLFIRATTFDFYVDKSIVQEEFRFYSTKTLH